MIEKTTPVPGRRPPAAAAWLGALIVLPGLNLGLNALVVRSSVPLFLDSLGTAASSVLFGLPLGLATAFLTNLYQDAAAGFTFAHLPFAVCGMATAIIVRAAARRAPLWIPARFLAVTGAVALANSVLGAVIATFVFGGGTGVNVDILVAGFMLAFDDMLSASFLARLAINLVDKAPAILAAALAQRWLAGPASPRAR